MSEWERCNYCGSLKLEDEKCEECKDDDKRSFDEGNEWCYSD